MSMPDYVTDVWLFITTSTAQYAKTAAGLQLELALPGQVALLETARETLRRGLPAQFHWTPASEGTVNWTSASFVPADVSSLKLKIVGDSGDAWLPSSVWVIVNSQVSGYQVFSAYPAWPSNQWFSSDPKEGSPAYALQIRSLAAKTVAVGDVPIVGAAQPA